MLWSQSALPDSASTVRCVVALETDSILPSVLVIDSWFVHYKVNSLKYSIAHSQYLGQCHSGHGVLDPHFFNDSEMRLLSQLEVLMESASF